MTKQYYIGGLVAVVVMHWLVLLLFAANIIPQQSKQADTLFWFHHGGDNYGYFAQAQALVTGDFQANKYPLGFPILMVPALWLLPGASHDVLVQPIAFFWAGGMFPLALLMLMWLSEKMLEQRWLALASGAVFALLPVLWLGLFNLLWNREMAEIIAIHSTWAQMLSDGPTAFFTLLAAALFVQIYRRDYPWLLVVALGAVLGFLGLLRFSGVLIAFVIGSILLIERRWRAALVLLFVALITFAPQMIYNQIFFDGPLQTGYTQLEQLPEQGLFHPVYLLDALGKIWQRLGLISLIAAAIGIGIFVWAIYRLYRHNWRYALLIAGWIMSYLAFYSVYYYSWTGALMRFLIPAYPAFVLLGTVLLQDVTQPLWQKRQHNEPAQ